MVDFSRTSKKPIFIFDKNYCFWNVDRSFILACGFRVVSDCIWMNCKNFHGQQPKRKGFVANVYRRWISAISTCFLHTEHLAPDLRRYGKRTPQGLRARSPCSRRHWERNVFVNRQINHSDSFRFYRTFHLRCRSPACKPVDQHTPCVNGTSEARATVCVESLKS